MPAVKRGAKRNRSHPNDPSYDDIRKKIQTTQIINRLVNHALGKNKMTTTQVTAGMGLLRKVLPDLVATEHSGTVEAQSWIGPPPKTAEEWEEEHGETRH